MVKQFFLFLLMAVAVFKLYSAPETDLWPIWEKHDTESTFITDNSLWNEFLKNNLTILPDSKEALINYRGITEIDKKNLQTYIRYLSQLSPDNLNRNEQKAFWINLYNALTVNVIINNYPVKSIRDIKLSGLFTSGPWKEPLVTISGYDISLNDIEHRILRPIWKDERIHYAVNCASRGCPNLQKRAYTSSNLEALLNKGAADFINSEKGIKFNGNNIILSSIYKWFSEDFGSSENDILKSISEYIEDDDLKIKIMNFTGKIYYKYNWKLNEIIN